MKLDGKELDFRPVARAYGEATGVHTIYFDGGPHPVEEMPQHWKLTNLRYHEAERWSKEITKAYEAEWEIEPAALMSCATLDEVQTVVTIMVLNSQCCFGGDA